MAAIDKSRVPVIVGCARFTPANRGASGLSLIQLMAKTSEAAAEDALPGRAEQLLREVQTVAVVSGGPPNDMAMLLYPNQPKTLSEALGCPAKVHHQRCRGGDGAVGTTCLMAQRIADGAPGTDGLVLLSGAMNSKTVQHLVQEAAGETFRAYEGAQGVNVLEVVRQRLGWDPNEGGSEPEFSGTREVFNSEEERLHGLLAPVDAYPLYESRLRYAYGRGVAEHQDRVGELMSRFSGVAASDFNKAYSWYPTERTKAQIVTATSSNRWVGWPYTKLMNAQAVVDHSASWLMCSAASAERLGIPEDRWVYVHGGAYANQGDPATPQGQTWFVSRWTSYSRIPAMEAALRGSLASAGLEPRDVGHFDFYACFPAVVEMAADCLGLAHDDPRGLTVSGGLPYYGQCGTLSALVAMVQTLRRPENRRHFGLVSGNGGLGQKHSAAVLSTSEPSRRFRMAPWQETQGKVDAIGAPAFTSRPEGAAEIVTYTVKHGRGTGPVSCIVIGRLLATGEQFIANTPGDPALLEAMKESEWIGTAGRVFHSGDARRNVFVPDGWEPRARL